MMKKFFSDGFRIYMLKLLHKIWTNIYVSLNKDFVWNYCFYTFVYRMSHTFSETQTIFSRFIKAHDLSSCLVREIMSSIQTYSSLLSHSESFW